VHHASVHSPLPLWVATRIDDEAIEHYRGVGGFTPAEDLEELSVDLVQRDDLSPDGDPTKVRHHPAQIRIAGIRLSQSEAVHLARLLSTAVTVINETERPPAIGRVRRSFNGGYGLAPVSEATLVPQQQRSA
jgi:hypothetical protein